MSLLSNAYANLLVFTIHYYPLALILYIVIGAIGALVIMRMLFNVERKK